MKYAFIVLSAILLALNTHAQPPVEPLVDPEVSPEYPGGESAMFKFISINLKYPQLANDCDCQGKVFVKFIVTEDGSLDSIKVLKKPVCNGTIYLDKNGNVLPDEKNAVDTNNCSNAADAMEAEVVRIIKKMPNWKPATQNGKPVKVVMTLPINFVLR